VELELLSRSIAEAEVFAHQDAMFLLKHINRIVDSCHLLLLIVVDAELDQFGKNVIVTNSG